MENIIPIWTYEYLCRIKSPFTGYVWKPNGQLFRAVMVTKPIVNDRPPGPFRNAPGIERTTRFLDTIEVPAVTLVDIGNKSVVYDEEGNFVGVLDAPGSEKGQIKIKKIKPGERHPTSDVRNATWDELTTPRVAKDFIDIGETNLSNPILSKIFTHIVSQIGQIDITGVLMEEISISQYDGNDDYTIIRKYNNGGEKIRTIGSHRKEDGKHVVTAYISPDNLLNHLNTVYNVINVLGDHELLGHGFNGWEDKSWEHHLVYYFQMGRPSWKNTTQHYKNCQIEDGLKGIYVDYAKREERKIAESDKMSLNTLDSLRRIGLAPKSFKYTTEFDKQMEKRFKNGNTQRGR